MANWLTITWENDRLMVLAAKGQGKSTTFEHAAVFKLDAPEDSASATETGRDTSRSLARPSQVSLKKQLERFLRDNRLTRSETIVVMSRADVEVRPMVFPPVPVEELPDLVKFQAAKEFNGYDPNSPLDFFITNKLENVSRSTLFPIVRSHGSKKETTNKPQPTGAPKHVLASTIRSDTLKKIQSFCEDLNLSLRQLVLRPCEAVYLLRQEKGYNPERTVLFVELETSETSQTVLFQGEPVFMRSPKISCPEDVTATDFVARLVAELKRTRIAVRNEIQGVTVDEVVFCGVSERFDTLARQVSDAMEIPARTFDPFSDITLGSSLRKQIVENKPDSPERFASLVGATLRAVKGEEADIDFCNPKKRPESVGQRQVLTGVLAGAFLLLVCVIGFGFYSRTALTKEVKILSNKKLELEKAAKTVGSDRTQLKAIDDWKVDTVNWFEQIGWLSRSVPSSRDMILTGLAMSANQAGTMTLNTLVRDASVVSPMEERLRDDKHDVKTAEKGEVKGNLLYGFRFNLSVALQKQPVGTPKTETIETEIETKPPSELPEAVSPEAVQEVPSESPEAEKKPSGE